MTSAPSCGSAPGAARWPSPSRSRSPGCITARTGRAVELVGITTFGDVSQGELAADRRHRRVRQRAAHSLLARRHRLRRALAEGPARRAGARAAAGRGPAPGRPAGRAGRQGRRQARRPAGRREDRHRLAAPGRAAAACSAPTCSRSRSAATRAPGWARSTSGEVDAVVLAYAGLARIGRLDAVTQVFEPDEMLPAPGQGALAVECLADRHDLAALLASLTTRSAEPGHRRRARPARRAAGRRAARRSARTLRAARLVARRAGKGWPSCGCRPWRRPPTGSGRAGQRDRAGRRGSAARPAGGR